MGGGPLYLKKKIKSIQLEAARLAIGPKSRMWSATTLLKNMKWLPLEDLIKKIHNENYTWDGNDRSTSIVKI